MCYVRTTQITISTPAAQPKGFIDPRFEISVYENRKAADKDVKSVKTYYSERGEIVSYRRTINPCGFRISIEMKTGYTIHYTYSLHNIYD